MSALVQPLEEHLSVEYPEMLDSFVVEDPTRIDFLNLVGSDPDARGTLLKWKTGPSDIPGC